MPKALVAEGGELAARLEAAFMRVSGKRSARGARAWIARLARLHPQSVSRILKGQLPRDRIEAVLDALELGWRAARRTENAEGVDGSETA